MNKKKLYKALAKTIGSENILSLPRDLIAYSYDATGKRALPDIVVFPNNTAEVSAVMKLAHRYRVPVVARGSGTNLTGGTVTIMGGIVLELSRLNHIRDIDTAGRRAVVEPGVINLDLQNALRPFGFMYAPDPASQKSCTLGGNMAEDAGGPHCLKYGVTSNHILGLEVVLADGQVVQVGTATDDSYGYDLLGPLVGSEGTLGIATKLILRIMRLPESFQTMLATYENLEDAGQSVSDIIAAGIVPAALELMDAPVVRVIEDGIHAGYPIDAEAILLIELDGLKEALERQWRQIVGICQTNNAREIRLAYTAAERERLWLGRRGAFGAVARMRPAYAVQDATVPRNKLVPMLREISKIAQRYRLLIGNVAHAGDGNLHPLMMFDNRDIEESRRVEKAGKEILTACVALEGTISGEHGIGLEKMDSMPLMFNQNELELMRLVKRVFDPEEILNPGKIIPPQKAMPADIGDSKAASISIPQNGKALYNELVEIIGMDNVLADPKKLAAFQISGKPPSLVVFPSHTDHVCQVVKAASRYEASLIPWGNGSKQAKGLPPTRTDIVLCLKHMNHLLELDASNLTAKVEAGVTLAELKKELAGHNLFFPLEPEDIELATIGGTLATNGNGPGRLACGTARDLVLQVTAVTPLGEAIRAGSKTMKNVAGYDLRKLFLGSWGTLGVITEAILRLYHLPEDHKTLLLKLSSIGDVSRLAGHILNSFLRPESMELIDAKSVPNLGPTAGFELHKDEALLLIGVAGTRESEERHIADIRAMAEANNARSISVLSGAEEKEAWAIQRRIRLYSAPGMVKGKAVVPIHKTGEMVQDINKVADSYQLQVSITGHAGSGILYPNLFPGENNYRTSEMLAAIASLIQSADKLGGFFVVESGPLEIRQAYDFVSQRSDYELMRRLKRAFDPKNILNPGKVVRTV